eukprot:TRINITY_DN3784_c0_g1_i2.p2 TRINITY_DN3784_c0_g1~~TRINITY_DN3784_c0_g1_i2.p2  ORF type:complete len:236 (+),score=104.75 TRINITY_DN3784_c0_g1_i2:150-857(+)
MAAMINIKELNDTLGESVKGNGSSVTKSKFMQQAQRVVCAALVLLFGYVAHFGPAGFNWQEPFQYHPSFMVLGYGLLMVEGISTGKLISKAPSMKDRKALLAKHMWFLTATIIAVLGAYAAIYMSKNAKGKPHLTTWHAYGGITAIVVLVLQSLLGYFIYFQLPAKFDLSIAVRAQLKRAHWYLAIASSLVGVAALWLGLASNFAAVKLAPFTRFVIAAAFGALHGMAMFYREAP